MKSDGAVKVEEQEEQEQPQEPKRRRRSQKKDPPARLTRVEKEPTDVPQITESDDEPSILSSQKFKSFLIPLSKVRAYWPLVRGGIEKVIEKTGHVSFVPEDVYAGLMDNSNALVMTFTPDDVYAGFCILGHDRDRYSGKRQLLMWLGYSVIDGAVEATLPFIEEMAKRAKIDYISFHTSRKGWLKVAPKLGYQLMEHVFVKRL